MAAIFTKGDIFHTEGVRAYAFGSNCRGTMDTGIAIAIKKRWPDFAAAFAAHAGTNAFHLGDVFEYRAGEETIFALALQEAEGKKGKLTALTKAATHLAERATELGIQRVGLARPGTGAAALEWLRVKSILTEVGDETDVAIVVFEQFVRAKTEE